MSSAYTTRICEDNDHYSIEAKACQNLSYGFCKTKCSLSRLLINILYNGLEMWFRLVLNKPKTIYNAKTIVHKAYT